MVVELYGRAGCCLCDEAREALERVRAERPFVLIERDIEADPALHRAYFERIPVVVVDGVEWSELQLVEADFRTRLDRAAAGLAGAGDDLESRR